MVLPLSDGVGGGSNLIDADGSFCADKGVIFGEKEHTVAFFALAHGDAWAVPIGGFGFGFFVFVVTTGTERSAEFVFVFGESFDDNSRDAQVGTKVGVGIFRIFFGKFPHGF
jgi:hypothetical protein